MPDTLAVTRRTDDQVAEFVLKRIDELRVFAAQIGEDEAVEQLEDAFSGVLNRYQERKIQALNQVLQHDEQRAGV
ncbi:MAG: hypothetical protein ACTHLA_13865 [Asticcacaulis sp.]|uniref:hypothetical protein n=1 Tax=Asticcacaulis sp. TaxID=1872648 RepID=UPI003F7BCDC0